MADSTDMEVEWKADIWNVLIKIEMAVKSDTKQHDVVNKDVSATAMEVRFESDCEQVPKQNFFSFSWI